MLLVVYLHTMSQSVLELLALMGPAAVIFGAGTFVVILPIVRAGGDRYRHKEHVPEQVATNGHNHSRNGKAEHPAEQRPETSAPRKN
jgi:hypothetical protein